MRKDQHVLARLGLAGLGRDRPGWANIGLFCLGHAEVSSA